MTDNLTLSANLSFLDGEWDEYEGVNCYLNPRQTLAQGCVELLDVDGNPTGTFGQDLSGGPLQFAPDYSGTVTANYRAPIGDNLEFFGTVSVFFTEEYLLSADGDPGHRQGSYSKVDARIGIGVPNGRWNVALVGRNLNDENVLEWIGNAPLSPGQASDFGLLKRTRQIALQGIFRLGV